MFRQRVRFTESRTMHNQEIFYNQQELCIDLRGEAIKAARQNLCV